MSVAKSFTSTLVGLALADGKIKSLDDPITDYVPELKGSGYDGVPIKAILQMSSGVKFTERYVVGQHRGHGPDVPARHDRRDRAAQ